MPAYSYRAVHREGYVTKGVTAAANEQELTQSLSVAGLELIDATEKKITAPRHTFTRPVPPRSLAVFCAQMQDMLQADVPLLDALNDAAAAAIHTGLRAALADIGRQISHGGRMAESFGRYPKIFPAVFIAILGAGERSGDMAQTFSQLARYADDRARLTEKLRRALRYPLFLLLVTAGVTSFMMTLVVPQIVQFLLSINSALPLPTRILIAVSSAFTEYWWMLLAGGVVLMSLVMLARRLSPEFACAIDGWSLRIPVLGPVWRKLILARFMHSFAILFQSGLGVREGMAGARPTLVNRALEAALDEAERQVQSGQALSSAMTAMLPPFALRMLRIGEQSGKLGKSLGDIAVTYDRESGEAVERLIGSLEPMLTMLVGGLLAWIVLAVLGPIYGSLSTLNMMSY